MKPHIRFTLTALVFLWLGTIFPAGKALGQQAESTLKNQLVGTWTLTSNFTNREDGSKVDILGPSPTGMLMFDDGGRFSLHEMRSDLPRLGSNSRQGTEAEKKALVEGSIGYFGTYKVDEGAKTLTIHIDACSLPNWNGTDQKKSFTVSKDELTWSDVRSSSKPVYTVWKRARP
jgi:Lipocalin-like domain